MRNGDQLHNDELDNQLWRNNLNSLLGLLDQNNPDDLIITAEIHRNLGEFDVCLDILSKIDDSGFSEAKAILEIECGKKNNQVILLEPSE